MCFWVFVEIVLFLCVIGGFLRKDEVDVLVVIFFDGFVFGFLFGGCFLLGFRGFFLRYVVVIGILFGVF